VNAAAPDALSALIVELLEKDPAKRPASAQDVERRLAEIEHQLAAPARTGTESFATPTRGIGLRSCADDVEPTGTESYPAGAEPEASARVAETTDTATLSLAGAADRSGVLSHRRRRVPAWASMAAAILLIGGGIGLYQVIIIRDKEGNKIAEIKVPPGGKVEVVDDDEKPPFSRDPKGRVDTPLAKPPVAIGPVRSDGRPLSPLALVTRPAPLPGVRSWTVETVHQRGGNPSATAVAGVWPAPLALNADRSRLAVAGDDGTLRIFDVNSGRLLQALLSHERPITQIAWTRDGKWLASAGADETRIWDAATATMRQTLPTFATASASEFFWSNDGMSLAVLCSGSQLRIFETASGKSIRLWETGYSRGIHWLPDNKGFLAVTSDGRLRRIDHGRAEAVELVRVPAAPAPPYAFILPDGLVFGTCQSRFGPTLWLWKTANGRPTGVIVPLSRDRSLAVSPEGHYRGTPAKPPVADAPGSPKARSGILVQGRYLLPITDSDGQPTNDADTTGAIYRKKAPSSCRDGYDSPTRVSHPAGVWQSLEIDFEPPVVEGKVKTPAKLTVRHNGFTIHDRFATAPTERAYDYKDTEPGLVVLQGNTGGVQFRNVWVEKLP
jgi:hypothetical protein